ncbi:MAG: hypothetical protein F4Z92_09820 [Gemmatimonadetes bacterium]|nr:hypothetical protein [Gemmatimonadota bacterium]
MKKLKVVQAVSVVVVAAVGTIAAVMTCYNSDMCYFRKNTTKTSVQLDIVQEVREDAVREDALSPSETVFILELISLKCNTRQERRRHAPDEAYLKVMDDSVTQPFKMDSGHMVNLDHLSYQFVGSAEIELWDSDKDEDNENDYLGNTFARASDYGQGEIVHEFTGSGAHYVLTYRVKKKSRDE